jgi:hypothetical protein
MSWLALGAIFLGACVGACVGVLALELVLRWYGDPPPPPPYPDLPEDEE